LPLALFGQAVEGVIFYEQKVNMHRNLDNEEMKQYLPEFQTSQMQLLVKGQTTLYKSAPEDEAEIEGGDGNVTFRMKRSESEVYKDRKAKEQLTATEFMGRNFLIREDLESRSWKMTGESKSILGYACNKAVYEDTANVVEAWFTLALPGGGGPASYDGLPGIVLEVDVNDGERVITATKVDLKPLEKDQMEKPSKGKKVTREEYDAIVKEKMEEIGGSSSGGRVFRIIRQ